jgi:Cys-tRNA(Pro)/Cys-tRNA(Cys) deacylase
VSPLGQKKKLKTFIDDSALGFDTIFVSAGRRGLEIELAPRDLATLVNGGFFPLHQE